jgi:hypothetical protein
MELVSCRDCRQCNHKGKPSITRGSKYCDDHRISMRQANKEKKFGLFTNIKNRMFEKRAKYDDKGQLTDLKQKGFRESWFWK